MQCSSSLLRYGLLRVAAVSPALHLADVSANVAELVNCARSAAAAGARLIVTPELGLTGHSCGDLFFDTRLRLAAERALLELAAATAELPQGTALVAGVPLQIGGQLYNCAAVLAAGRVVGIVPKTFLPNYGEFYEARWFSPSRLLRARSLSLGGLEIPVGTDLLFSLGADAAGKKRYFGIEICEDLWAVQPPSGALAAAGALVIVNLSASTEQLGKHAYRKELVRQQSARCLAAYVYAGSGAGESSTDVVYSGSCLIAENGVLLGDGERFSFESRYTYADIDLEALEHERLRNGTFSQALEHCAPLAGSSAATAISAASAISAAAVACGEFRLLDVCLDTCPPERGAQGQKQRPLQGGCGSRADDDEAAVPTELSPEQFALLRPNPALPFVPEGEARRAEHCEEIFTIQQTALARRLRQLGGSGSVVIGISGGLDSTLALLVCVRALDALGLPRERILGVTMPGFGTTARTRTNATDLMEALGVRVRTIPIEAAVRQHFADIGHDAAVHDIVFENAQARERTQILMDLANQQGGLLVGTGDLSEAALGWSTYGGDHISMYHVNTGVPKTLVRYLVQWCAQALFDGQARGTLLDIVATPISPELLPPDPATGHPQDTEATVGPYELHDFFLYHFVRHGASPEKIRLYAAHAFNGRHEAAVIDKWLAVFLRRFFTQQFKRSCTPDGPKVGSVALSPRGDWRMPSDASFALWR